MSFYSFCTLLFILKKLALVIKKNCRVFQFKSSHSTLQWQQEAQLSQRYRATLCVMWGLRSLKVIAIVWMSKACQLVLFFYLYGTNFVRFMRYNRIICVTSQLFNTPLLFNAPMRDLYRYIPCFVWCPQTRVLRLQSSANCLVIKKLKKLKPRYLV